MFFLNNVQNKKLVLLLFSFCTFIYSMNPDNCPTKCFLSNLSAEALVAYVQKLYSEAGLTNYTIRRPKDNKIEGSSSSSDDSSDNMSSLFEDTLTDECDDKRMDSIIEKMFDFDDDNFNNDDINSYKKATYEDIPTLHVQKNVLFPPTHINKVQKIIIHDPYKDFISLSSKKRTKKREWPERQIVWQQQRAKIGTTSIGQLG